MFYSLLHLLFSGREPGHEANISSIYPSVYPAGPFVASLGSRGSALTIKVVVPLLLGSLIIIVIIIIIIIIIFIRRQKRRKRRIQ